MIDAAAARLVFDTWWQPAHLGGTAPTLEQAAALDANRDDPEGL